MKPAAYICRARLHSERQWISLDLEVNSKSLKRLRRYLRATHFRMFSGNKILGNIDKVGSNIARDQQRLEFLTVFDYMLEQCKGSANGNADLLSSLPEPATMCVDNLQHR